jgi:uncharacterized membrane protein
MALRVPRGRPWGRIFGTEMGQNRLEAFSEGAIAIPIAIMVLRMQVAHGENLAQAVLPLFLTFVLGFLCVGIYRMPLPDMVQAA